MASQTITLPQDVFDISYTVGTLIRVRWLDFTIVGIDPELSSGSSSLRRVILLHNYQTNYSIFRVILTSDSDALSDAFLTGGSVGLRLTNNHALTDSDITDQNIIYGFNTADVSTSATYTFEITTDRQNYINFLETAFDGTTNGNIEAEIVIRDTTPHGFAPDEPHTQYFILPWSYFSMANLNPVWLIPAGSLPQVDSQLVPDGVQRYLHQIGIGRTSNMFQLGFSDDINTVTYQHGEDLSPQFEMSGYVSLKLDVNNTIYGFAPNNTDTSEVYEWDRTADETELQAFINPLNATDQFAAILALRNFNTPITLAEFQAFEATVINRRNHTQFFRIGDEFAHNTDWGISFSAWSSIFLLIDPQLNPLNVPRYIFELVIALNNFQIFLTNNPVTHRSPYDLSELFEREGSIAIKSIHGNHFFSFETDNNDIEEPYHWPQSGTEFETFFNNVASLPEGSRGIIIAIRNFTPAPTQAELQAFQDGSMTTGQAIYNSIRIGSGIRTKVYVGSTPINRIYEGSTEFSKV